MGVLHDLDAAESLGRVQHAVFERAFDVPLGRKRADEARARGLEAGAGIERRFEDHEAGLVALGLQDDRKLPCR